MKKNIFIISFINLYLISFGQEYDLTFNKCSKKKTYKIEREFYILDNLNNSLDTLVTNSKGSVNFNLSNLNNKSILYFNQLNQFMKVNAGFLKTNITNHICYDSLMYSHHPFIDQLNPHDTLKIRFHASGCFRLDSCTILLIKRTDKTELQLYKRGKIRDSKNLTNKEIETFRLFEIELINHHMSTGNCSKEYEDEYLITFKTKEKYISDRTCSWGGLYGLLDEFGLKQK